MVDQFKSLIRQVTNKIRDPGEFDNFVCSVSGADEEDENIY